MSNRVIARCECGSRCRANYVSTATPRWHWIPYLTVWVLFTLFVTRWVWVLPFGWGFAALIVMGWPFGLAWDWIYHEVWRWWHPLRCGAADRKETAWLG